MLPISCVNCCFNGLQYDTIGTSFGFCTEHKKVLLSPSETTCGRLLRKDLLLPSARRQNELHAQRYTPSAVCSLRTGSPVNGTHASSDRADIKLLQQDPVSDSIVNYGRLGTKIASLAQLKVLPGPRAELALLSLGRTYVQRCIDRGGSWKSGLHLMWWTGSRLAEDPRIDLADLRVELSISIARQVELAKWALMMLRLTFVSDVGHHASSSKEPIRKLADLPEEAAADTNALSASKLRLWIKRNGVKRFDAALPESRYERLSSELSRAEGDAG
ncbi:MAG: hypothetical protein R3B70_01265 [Polyangiaceae bacterium]